jgi:hypothetical protein
MILDVSQLNEYVFLGSCVMAVKGKELKDLGISCIVNLTPEKWGWEEQGFEEYQIPIDDGVSFDAETILPAYFDRMDRWILAGKRIFIHCHMGVSRTATFAIALMMHQRQAGTLNQDLRYMWGMCEDEVRMVRPVIEPAYTLKRTVLLHFGWDPYASAFSHSS